MIPNRRIYERARNNGHPNARGYQAMADDIYDFLRKDAKLIPSDPNSDLSQIFGLDCIPLSPIT
jgi:hypothetical protein